MSDIIDRLNEACKGYPAAWPHRLLHDAISEIERLRGVAQALPDLERLASKIERQDVEFKTDGDFLTDADSELICTALRARSDACS